MSYIHSTYGGEVRIASWWGHLKEREKLEDIGVERRIIINEILKKQDERACS